jgi:hypothetical protein
VPKVLNGHKVEPTPDFQEAVAILGEVRGLWQRLMQDTPTDPVIHTRLGVVAFTQWAAMLGVDVGMTQEQFTAVCEAQFKAAYDRAPRFS